MAGWKRRAQIPTIDALAGVGVLDLLVQAGLSEAGCILDDLVRWWRP
ncbi:MAG: hypothetical protein HZC55_28745 [Verrucomicrobia bacterium]|nr:hypothetical protein [Verrucomicrobiota bacterium]